MKNLLLTLLLISPLTKSEVLELTCESAFPFWVSVDLDSKEGKVTYQKESFGFEALHELIGSSRPIKPEIKKIVITDDFYVIYNGGYTARNPPSRIAINRRNLKFFSRIGTGLISIDGTCKIGIHELPDYQIW